MFSPGGQGRCKIAALLSPVYFCPIRYFLEKDRRIHSALCSRTGSRWQRRGSVRIRQRAGELGRRYLPGRPETGKMGTWTGGRNVRKEKLVYHGSNAVVQEPRILVNGYYKDFGYGFYCASLIKQAKRWALTKRGESIVNCYTYVQKRP